jgi:hypothetical protein
MKMLHHKFFLLSFHFLWKPTVLNAISMCKSGIRLSHRAMKRSKRNNKTLLWSQIKRKMTDSKSIKSNEKMVLWAAINRKWFFFIFFWFNVVLAIKSIQCKYCFFCYLIETDRTVCQFHRIVDTERESNGSKNCDKHFAPNRHVT